MIIMKIEGYQWTPSEWTAAKGHVVNGAYTDDNNVNRTLPGDPWAAGTVLTHFYQQWTMIRAADNAGFTMNTQYLMEKQQMPPVTRTETFWPGN